jgi:predicted anti-sigma-YlaC factor YlaD
MNCEKFQSVLDDFLTRTLAGETLAEAQTHLDRCQLCQDLVALLNDDLALPDVEAPTGLAAAVLERTTGPACSRAREMLAGYTDKDLDETGYDLVTSHLQSCGECHALESALIALAVDLPTLAEMETPRDLFSHVLATTSEKPNWRTRFVATWRHLVERPRFAFESAYVGLITLVLVFGLPFTDGKGDAAIELARFQPVQSLFAQDGILAETARDAADLTALVRGEISKETRTGLNWTQQKAKARAGNFSTWYQERRDAISRQWTNEPDTATHTEPIEEQKDSKEIEE